MTDKTKFLAVDDYGSGGIWLYILARDEKDIRTKYPKLKIVRARPEWLDAHEATGRELTTLDVDMEVPESLRYLT